MRLRELSPNEWRVSMRELFEHAWLNCYAASRYNSDDLDDVFESLMEAFAFNPKSIGTPHPMFAGLWIYETPPIRRLPKIYVLYEIADAARKVTLWAAHFP